MGRLENGVGLAWPPWTSAQVLQGESRLQGQEMPRVAAQRLQTPVGGLPFSLRDL